MQPNPRHTSLDRRELFAGTLAGAGVLALGSSAWSASSCASSRSSAVAGQHELPPLPYAEDALAPLISANTLSFHYGKHHKSYVDNLNGLLKDDSALASLSLDELVKKTSGDAAKVPIFNNAAQIWNHSFYWKSMRSGGGGEPKGRVLELMKASFGDYARFKEAFAAAAKTQFGSGWVWLVAEGDKLAVVKTGNADTPMAQGKKCLLTCDVWEHAYYLDYQNRRADFVTAYLDHLVDWQFANANLA